MKYELHSSEAFNKWLGKLKDAATKRKVFARLARVENGNFGDHKQINPDLFELRLFFSSGLRIYYTIRDKRVVFLLAGGDKSSQTADIAKAEQILSELE